MWYIYSLKDCRMNHLAEVTALKNRYFALRHGQSQANIEEIILSHPENGTAGWGLSDTGKEQAAQAGRVGVELGMTKENTEIYTSDFVRAEETAKIFADAIGSDDIHISQKLRERHFGNFEKQHNSNYDVVWASDVVDPTHQENDVESVASVQDRTTSLILELEGLYEGKNLILVSHGDALQILQTGFAKIDSKDHRSLPHLNTAELRELTLA